MVGRNSWRLAFASAALSLFAFLSLDACVLAPRQAASEQPLAVSTGDFAKLPEYASRNGVLKLSLTARPRALVVDGVRLDAVVFNGVYGGPVLRLSPGDRLQLKLFNRTTQPINLHFHGSYASPQGHGDNVHAIVAPGDAFDYRLTVPAEQPPGLYWYHTHIHGLAEEQVNAGLSGAMIIEGVEQRVPETHGARQRLLVLKSFSVNREGDPNVARLHGVVQTINGVAHTNVTAQAGVPEFWRISNQSPNDYYHLSIKGVRFRIVGLDGAPTQHDTETDHLDIAPAGRVEAMVVVPTAGDYRLLSGSTPTGEGKAFKVTRELALIHAGAPPAAPPSTLSDQRRGLMSPDLQNATVTGRRTVVFSQKPGEEVYLLNGRIFDHHRIDARVPLGAVEDWTIRNDTDDMHVFHIHQLHFQVMSINGRPQAFDSVADTVRIPERGEVVVRIPFTNPQMVGHFVYHCHVLKHEDRGMMANIEVYDPKIASASTGHEPPAARTNLPWLFSWMSRAPVIGGYICHTPPRAG